MFTKKTRVIGVFFMALLATGSALAGIAKSAEVYLNSDPGSWVGGAIGAPTVDWVHGVDGVFSGSENYGSFNQNIQIGYNNGSSWLFNFSAPTYNPDTNTNTGQPLHVGLYTGAQRFPFNSPTKPGLSVSGNGRGDNTLTGWFNVLEISFTSAGDLDKFAVDFKQFDESSINTGLYGSLRFNSTIAITPVPEPESYAMLLVGLGVVGSSVAWRRKTKQS